MDREAIRGIGIWTLRCILVIGGIVGGIAQNGDVIVWCMVLLFISLF